MRNLVSLRPITSLSPIPGADRIETALIDNWKVVVKKGEFQPGDICVYFETDSMLPVEDPRFAFLADRAKEYKGKQYARLKTIRLKKQLSQGLALPIGQFQELLATTTDGETAPDMAQQIGVLLYEEEVSQNLRGQPKGNWPSFLRKTDQERVQNMPWVYEDKDSWYEVTVKHDGTSLTVFNFGDKSGVCSRNLELKVDESNAENLYVKTANSTGLLEALTKYGKNLAVQGEICGPGIQSCRGGETEVKLYVFDIFDIEKGEYLDRMHRQDILGDLAVLGFVGDDAAYLGIHKVPTDFDALMEIAERTKFNDRQVEGLVYKRLDARLSFKVIANSYLLAHDL
jgi:RNA ligase (TIGR02306 family)